MQRRWQVVPVVLLAATTLVACSSAQIVDAADPSEASDAAHFVDARSDAEVADAGSDAAPVVDSGSDAEVVTEYVAAPADGGTCALEHDIVLYSRGPDLSPSTSISLLSPATVIYQRAGYFPDSPECRFPPPACDTVALPDFADVRTLLARPSLIALLQSNASYGDGDSYFGLLSLTVADVGSIAIVGQDTCPSCIPSDVTELRDLVFRLGTAHTCSPPAM